jgi:ABC-type branched-subunit amino acid transport system substrate-binding protein
MDVLAEARSIGMGRGSVVRAVGLASAVLLVAGACGTTASTEGAGGTKRVKLYGTDGNMGNALGAKFSEPGSLLGLRGTTPLTKLGSDFVTRLKQINPRLVDLNYSGESYDAVVITALASEMARTNSGPEVAKRITSVTNGTEKCTDFKACLQLIKAGKSIQYNGVTGALRFTDQGEPSRASFGLLQFGKDNKIDEAKTEYVLAGDSARASNSVVTPLARTAPASGGPLIIGSLLPLTGSLAFIGPPEVAGVELAIKEVNAAGGVNGRPVQLVAGDSGDASTDLASQTVDRFLQAGVNAIIGAASSAVSLKVIDKVTGSGVILFSPANTSDRFTNYPTKGLYFRTAPPDKLQAKALADAVIADGNRRIGVLALNDPYGTGLADNLVKNLRDAGVTENNIRKSIYDPKATDFSSDVSGMKEFNPDAIVVIGFDESATLFREMNQEGIGPKR